MKGQNILFYEVNTMSLFSFIFFPRKVDMEHFKGLVTETGVYDLNDLEKYSFINKTLLGVYLHESEKAYFKGTFRNKYYYILSVNSFHDPNHVKSIKEQLDMGLEITDKKALEHLINASLFLNLLYSIIDRNINNGEFVEIYSEWLSDEWKYVWGPPKKTIELSLNDILSFGTLDIFSEQQKYIIYK